MALGPHRLCAGG